VKTTLQQNFTKNKFQSHISHLHPGITKGTMMIKLNPNALAKLQSHE